MATEQDWAAYADQAFLGTTDTLLVRKSAGGGVEVPGSHIVARQSGGGDYTAGGNLTAVGASVVLQAYATSGVATVRIYSAAGNANQKTAELQQSADGTTLYGRFVNDAYSAADNWLQVIKNSATYTVAGVIFPSAGYVGVGTGGDWTGGFAKFYGNTAVSNGRAVSAYASQASGGSAFLGRVDNTAIPLAAWYYTAGTVVGSITTTGTATAYNTSSDYRLKEDLQPLTGALDRILALPVYDFAWKSTGERARGFMAHEFGEIIPGAATGEKDGMREEVVVIEPEVPAEYDVEGNLVTPGREAVTTTQIVPDYQGIDQAKAVPDLVAAVQELTAIVRAQAAQIAALESRL